MATLLQQRVSPADATEAAITAEIAQSGCFGPIPLLSPETCLALWRHLMNPSLPPRFEWWKGRAITDRALYEIATRPELIAWLRPLLGENIVLWGASTVDRHAGTRHPWHTDVESASPDARAVSVWIGIRNTSRESGLMFVARSQHFGRSVQEALAGLGEDRDSMTDARLLEIARTIDPAASIVQPELQNGDALLFDGRTWHCGRNDKQDGARSALLLQYASADTPILIPTSDGYNWPFRFDKQAPTILVSGSGRGSANRVVPPPPRRMGGPMIRTLARTVALPLSEDPDMRWKAYPQFRGATGTLAGMSCHISVLSPGHSPHAPHIHDEEELLILLDGTAEIELADGPDRTNGKRHAMNPGMFSYYPATQHHTIHNAGVLPVTYLMFKWRSTASGAESPMHAGIFEYEPVVASDQPNPMAMTLLFQQATDQLPKLHAHLTTLQPGGGYEPHADPYDVAIVLLTGEVETVGKRVRPLGLIYYSAGELHGMRNVGSEPATYLVFEFHTSTTVAEARRQAEHAERRRRKLEKQKRKRGLRGLLRKLVKTAKKLAR